MRGLFDALFTQRRALALASLTLTGLGLFLGLRLPAAILPEVTFPRIKVIVDSGELSADEMLRAVTRPVENVLRRVPGVKQMRSTTSRGSTEINLDCAWRSDMNLALQRVQAQLGSVRGQLPAGSDVEARLMNPILFPVLAFSLVSDTRSLAELRDLATLVLRPELARLPGVADVVIQGGRRLEARVTLDPASLRARGLTAQRIADLLRTTTGIRSVGLLETNHELYLGLSSARPADLAALEAVPVPIEGGLPVPLGDLGRVSLEEAPEFTRYAAQGREAVLVNVLRQPTGSTSGVSSAVTRWLADHPEAIPSDVHVETFYDQSDLVRSSVGSVRDSLVVGTLLAIVIVTLFLGNLYLGLAGAAVLPISIGLTLLGLALTGQSLNMMTLGGVAAAVGLVLDDAIVVVEHLAHSHASGGASGSRMSTAMSGISGSMVGSSLCTVSIFLPFMMLGGVTGAFFRVLALSMVLMLASSLMTCLGMLPLLVRARPLGTPRATGDGLLQRLLRAALRHPRFALLLLAAAIIAIVPLKSTLGSGFLPEMDEGSLILDYVLPPGTSLTEADAMLQKIDRVVAEHPDVVAWSRRTGDQLGFFITEPNTGDYVLRLAAGKRAGAEEIADDLRARIATVLPGAEVEFGQLIEDVIGDLTSNPQPVEVRILGEDRGLLEEKARAVAGLVSGVPGVVDVKDGIVVSGPNLSIAPGPGAAALGLTEQDLADAVEPAVAGLGAGDILRGGGRAWPVRVVVARPAGAGIKALGALPVPVGKDRTVPLGSVATLRVDPGEKEIDRADQRTMIAVTARLSGRDLGSAMREIQGLIRKRVPLPPGMGVRYGGQWEQQQSSFRDLASVMVGAVAAVLLILLVSFRSWRQTGAVLLVVTASLLGVFAALHVGGSTFNISSFVGAIMVVGIVAENAYFLVVEHRRGVASGMEPGDAARAAAERRLRPVLMTTAAGIAALAPLALNVGAGAALLSPLARAVVGGFFTSAPLILVVLPVLLGGTGRGRHATAE